MSNDIKIKQYNLYIMEEQFMDSFRKENLFRKGNLKEIQEFYNNNPSIDISADEEYIFCSACGYGLLEVAKWLLEIKPDINISVNNESPFRWACGEGHLEITNWLLEIKPDIDISAENEYAFRCVCAHGHLHAAKWLLEIKPDIDISAEDNNAFYSACRYKNEDVALWLTTLDPRYIVVMKNDIIMNYYVNNIQKQNNFEQD